MAAILSGGHTSFLLLGVLGLLQFSRSFMPRKCHIQLGQVQSHVDMLVGSEFGQKRDRLDVARVNEIDNHSPRRFT